MRLQIQKWNPSECKDHRLVLVIGRRGTGKSTLIADILHKMRDKFDMAVGMSPTEESLTMMRKHMPITYNSYNLGKVEDMILMQKEASRNKSHRSILLCLDDCMYEKGVLRSTAMRELFFNGRHLKICFVNAVQYMMDCEPSMRTQIDYVITLKEGIVSNKQKLWRYYFGVVPKFEDFCRILDRVTDNFGALVLDATTTSTDLTKCLFWYRASLDVPEFKLGKPIFWKLAQKHAKSKEDEERQRIETMREQQITRKTPKTPLRVTSVERQDKNGKTIPEDRNTDLLIIN